MKLTIKNSWLASMIICSWCGMLQKFVKSDKTMISHGICLTCKRKHF